MEATDTNPDAVKPRVKDFTYYPLMGDGECAFRVRPRGARVETYRQCPRRGLVEMEGYRFCKRHAEYIRTIVSKDND